MTIKTYIKCNVDQIYFNEIPRNRLKIKLQGSNIFTKFFATVVVLFRKNANASESCYRGTTIS